MIYVGQYISAPQNFYQYMYVLQTFNIKLQNRIRIDENSDNSSKDM